MDGNERRWWAKQGVDPEEWIAKVRERSYGFEAVKTALRQTKDGIAVTIVVHPNDVPLIL